MSKDLPITRGPVDCPDIFSDPNQYKPSLYRKKNSYFLLDSTFFQGFTVIYSPTSPIVQNEETGVKRVEAIHPN